MGRTNLLRRALAVAAVATMAGASHASAGSEAEASPLVPAAVSQPASSDTTGASDDEAVQGGSLTIGLSYTWATLDPLRLSLLYEISVARAVYDTLIEFDETGELAPGLAESWSSPDDGKTWVFELREGVTFHDGTAFDAAAVQSHLERLSDPENACQCLGQFDVVDSIEATGDFEVTIGLTEPLAWFPAVFVTEVGMVPSPTAVAELGEEIANRPVGAGPFRFVEQVPGDVITFERFEDYWRADEGLPYLDQISYRVVADQDARLAAVRSGEVHVMMDPATRQWAEAESAGLQLVEVGGIGSQFVIMNTAKPPFDDVRARQAVAHAIDVAMIHETISEGRLEPATSIFPRSTWAYPGEIESYPAYDPDRARALVEELGGLSFELTTTQSRSETAQALQAMWAEVGIEATITTMEAQTLVAHYRAFEHEATLTQYAGRQDPGIFAYRYFHSGNPNNYAQISDPDIDRLVEAAQQTVDQDERARLYAEFAERAAELVPYALLNNLNAAYIAAPGVGGLRAIPDEIIRPAELWRSE